MSLILLQENLLLRHLTFQIYFVFCFCFFLSHSCNNILSSWFLLLLLLLLSMPFCYVCMGWSHIFLGIFFLFVARFPFGLFAVILWWWLNIIIPPPTDDDDDDDGCLPARANKYTILTSIFVAWFFFVCVMVQVNCYVTTVTYSRNSPFVILADDGFIIIIIFRLRLLLLCNFFFSFFLLLLNTFLLFVPLVKMTDLFVLKIISFRWLLVRTPWSNILWYCTSIHTWECNSHLLRQLPTFGRLISFYHLLLLFFI